MTLFRNLAMSRLMKKSQMVKDLGKVLKALVKKDIMIQVVEFLSGEVCLKINMLSGRAPDKEARPSPYHCCSQLLGQHYHLTSLEQNLDQNRQTKALSW